MSVIRETDLPGIGHKYQITTRSGDKLVVVVHDDGRRELYHFSYKNPEQSISMITLDDAEARQVSSIIGGMSYKPRALEHIEVALDDLVIEWFKVEPNAPINGKSIGALQIRQTTGASIIAIVDDNHTKITNPGPDVAIREGMMLVVIGERQHIQAFKRMILEGT